MDGVALLAVVGASQCLLLAVVSYVQSPVPRLSDRLLTIILTIEGLRLFSLAAIASGMEGGPWLYTHALRLAVGPLLLFYTACMTGQALPRGRQAALHFLPLAGLMLVIFCNQVGLFHISRQALVPPVAFVEGLMFLLYGLAARRRVLNYHSGLLQTHSEVEDINLAWLRHVCVYLALMAVVLLVGGVILVVDPAAYSLGRAIVASSLTTLVFCYVIALKGIQQSRLFERQLFEEVQLPAPAVEEEDPRYASSALTREEAEHFFDVLERAMSSDKLFLQPRLKLADLADATGLHPQQLSQVINQCSGKRFYDYVNGYRVEEVKRLLEQGDASEAIILEVADRSGFNSPATFYKYFKKYTGQSPRNYVAALPVA